MIYSKEEIKELLDITNDPTWNMRRNIFTVKPTEAYLSRVDGKASDVLTEENLLRVTELMKEGGSLNEVCSLLGISRQTLMRWADKEGIIFDWLRDTIATGMVDSVAWWERKGREGIEGARYFKDHLWALQMMNRFGWLSGKTASQRTQEVTHEHKVQVNIPDLNDIKKLAFQEENIIDIKPKLLAKDIDNG